MQLWNVHTPFPEADMSNFFPCPNSECTYQFDADQLPTAAMVTCPLCHTRFPYRAAATRRSESDRGDEGFGRADRDDDDAGTPRKPRVNRLVNPRFVPKSNKTQAILMMVGLGVVVVVVLVVIIMAGKNNPYQSKRSASDTTTNDELNYIFRNWDKSWVEDSGSMGKMKVDGYSGFVRGKLDSDGKLDARILLFAKDFKKSSPRPNELRTAMNNILSKGFRSLDPPVVVPDTFAGQPAIAINFGGENDGKAITGEGFAFDYRGIGYIILDWSQNESWNAVKPEIDEYVKSFQFAGTRDKWNDTGASVEKYFVDGGNYQLEDVDAIWERGIVEPDDKAPRKKNAYIIPDIKDKDPKATMAFLMKSKKSNRPQTIVIELEQADDPLETVRAYWLRKLEAEDGRMGEVKITLDKDKLPAGFQMPKSEASVGVFKSTISIDNKDKKFFAISALNIGDKLVGAVSWCPDKEADGVGPMMLNFVASLRERK
jgi:hypothetical protein